MQSTALLRVILYASWFGLGVTAYLAAQSVVAAVRARGHYRRLNLAYATARGGLILVLGLVTLRIIVPATSLPVNPDTILYALGVLMVGGGYLGIAVESRKVDRRVQ